VGATTSDPWTQAVIPPSVLLGAVDLGESAGFDVRSWFAGTGADPAALATGGDARVSFQQATTVLRRAVRAMPDRPVGMWIGRRDVLLSYGMLGIAMRSSATVGEAVAIGMKFHQAAGSLLDVEVEHLGAESALRLYERRPDPELVALCCEEALCSTLLVLRTTLDPGWSPARIELTYPAPGYVSDYHLFFRCDLGFGAEANRMIFPSALLARPLPTHNESTRAFALDACRRLLTEAGDRTGVVAAIQCLLDRNLRRPPTMSEAAARLDVTERTLRRRLAEAGERFSDLRDRVRERRATLLLRESALPIDTIAREVGFSEAREFRRAYRRWTGRPPSAVRCGHGDDGCG
jgi:AraC-like DNA-binding protein